MVALCYDGAYNAMWKYLNERVIIEKQEYSSVYDGDVIRVEYCDQESHVSKIYGSVKL